MKDQTYQSIDLERIYKKKNGPENKKTKYKQTG